MSEKINETLKETAQNSVGYNIEFQDIANQNTGAHGDISVFNMTQVDPKVVNRKIQSKLNCHWIGANQWERSEPPHVTIKAPDDSVARIRIDDSTLMESTNVDKKVVKAVQQDIRDDPDKYIRNWNLNNPNFVIPLREVEVADEQSTQDTA